MRPEITGLSINDQRGSGTKKIKSSRQFCPNCSSDGKLINGAHINVIVIRGNNFSNDAIVEIAHEQVATYIVHYLYCTDIIGEKLIVWFVVPNCAAVDAPPSEPVAPIGALTVTVTTTEGSDDEVEPDVEPE